MWCSSSQSAPTSVITPGGVVLLGSSNVAVEAVFDTGGTRGSVSKEWLERIAADPATCDSILAFEEVNPIPCVGMDGDRVTYCHHVATLAISFIGDGRRVTVDLDFVVYPNSSEELIFSKPQLDDLGYESDKFSITLRAYDVTFASVLPAAETSRLSGERFLRLAENLTVRPSGENSWGRGILRVQSDRHTRSADKQFWIERYEVMPLL